MPARRFAIALVLVTTFCTLLLLVCPVASGPYSATHGPATSLRAMRFTLILMLTMLLAATSAVSLYREPALLLFGKPTLQILPPGQGRLLAICSELRC